MQVCLLNPFIHWAGLSTTALRLSGGGGSVFDKTG